mmetsp:Transcript_24426/g.34241  ORF Transcript_24426/g.34241 Transcript_24426/m.34241 type:complete len:672 (+) Transcript_24426:134-2149(+)
MENSPTPPTSIPAEEATPVKNVEYVLVAEFDIDKGSTITFQYPEATGEDTQLLAELMLPDGAHKRDDDWTVFFLFRPDTPGLDKTPKPKPKKAQKDVVRSVQNVEAYAYEYSEENRNQGWVQLGTDKKHITLTPDAIEITTKENSNITKSSINKHTELSYTQLEPQFVCVLTEQGTAIGFRFSTADTETIFIEHLEYLVKKVQDEEKAKEEKKKEEEQEAVVVPVTPRKKPFLYCLNLVHNQKDSSVRRGAVVKAMAVCTTHQYIQVYKPLIILALQKFFATPNETVLAEFYNAINTMDISGLPQYTDLQKQIIRSSTDKTKTEHSVDLNYITKMKLKIPTILFPDEVGDYKVITLVKKFGNQVLTIYNGLLQQKRILFLGFDCAAGEVCEYVLAACCMVCPPLKGLVKRAFPYTNLTYLDFLSVPGFIAGVTNPMFEAHTEWWDILCNINTGKVTVSSFPNAQPQQTPPEKYASYDNDLMFQVNASVQSHFGEDTVRSLFQNYTQHLLDMVFDEEEWPDEQAKQAELEANKTRLEAWKKTLTYQTYEQDRKLRRELSKIKDPAVPRYIRKLRICKHIPEPEMIQIYQTFVDSIKTEEQLMEFISYLPESNGGLHIVAVSLFHSSEKVRAATARLFRRLDRIQTGIGFINNLNVFLLIEYERTSKLLKDAD